MCKFQEFFFILGKKLAQEVQIQAQPPPLKTEMAKCEFCGKVDYRSKFKKSKKFCSISCAKRYVSYSFVVIQVIIAFAYFMI